MKDIFKSLKDNATSRLKNPVVGAFCLAWCALNVNGLAIFTLSDTETKIRIISGKTWSFSEDIAFPLFVAVIYLLLLPLLNLAYEFINDGVINNLRDKQQNQIDEQRFIRQKSTVGAKVEADEEYIRKLKDREIDNWLAEKGVRNNEFINHKEKYSRLLAALNEKEYQFAVSKSQLTSDYREVKSKLDEAEAESAIRNSFLEKVLSEIEVTVDNLDQLDDAVVKEDTKELRNNLEKIKVRFGIWDDIPF
ncbi:hypothetical protein [Enterovibrio norvegicus]|uniref:hypothetical protein n=1 Tax=Enterovibrio norvegicus TaxID=188144 RepID=UPI000C857946|nr:hypothetical protein [Enterovibrio norvegicus]PMN63888.1 hypothetical protein BCT27_24925 [Enterovibrio norvegicus]